MALSSLSDVSGPIRIYTFALTLTSPLSAHLTSPPPSATLLPMDAPQLPPDATRLATPDLLPAPDYYAQLNPRQQRFVDAYVANGGNGKQAYLSAGYSPEGADDNASHLLADNYRISHAISVKQAEFSARSAISQERIAEEIMSVGLLSIDEIISRGAKGILRVTDKLKALELLGKWKRMFEHEAGQGNQFILIIQPPPGADQPRSVGAEIPLAPGITLQVPPDLSR